MRSSAILLFAGIVTAAFLAGCGSTGVDTDPPAVPANFDRDPANSGDGQVRLTWQMNRENDLQGYYLYRAEGQADASYTRIAVIHKDSVSYTDTNLDYEIYFYYRLSAYDDADNESDRTEALLAIPANLSPPAAPQNVSAVAENFGIGAESRITLTWSPNTEGDFEKYLIYRSTGGTVPTTGDTLAVVPKGTQTYEDTAVVVGQLYYYKVIAVDRGNLSSEAHKSEVVSDVVLSPPMLVSPVDNSTTSSTPTFSWNTVPGATGYRVAVYSRISFPQIEKWSTTILNGTTTSVTYPTTAVALSGATSYWWAVSAITNDPEKPNSYSEAWKFTTQ
jgi:fibronectin type 3 domain-containing protein